MRQWWRNRTEDERAKFRAAVLLVVVIVAIFALTACSAVGPAQQLLSTPATEIHCTYDRVQQEVEWACSGKSIIQIEDWSAPGVPF